MLLYHLNVKWAMTWQNQQNECAPSKESDQPGHPPSLIRVFAVHMNKALVLSYPLSAQRRLWSDWADAKADLSLRLAHSHFVILSCRGSNAWWIHEWSCADIACNTKFHDKLTNWSLLGFMTKMASKSIYGKNLQKSPSSEPRDWWPWNLVYSIGHSSTTKFVQMMTLGWPWPFLWHGQICFLMLKFIQQVVMYFQAYALRWAIHDQWSSGLKSWF